MKESLKKFILSNWLLSEKVLLVSDVLLLGILLGWVTSPFRSKWKKGVDGSIDVTFDCEGDEEEE